MNDSLETRPLVRAADVDDEGLPRFAHPLNPASEVRGVSLGELSGLERVDVHLIRVAPGKEAFLYHTHLCGEEFLYVLSGRGVAEIGDDEHEIGPGDFLGFPTPSVAHHLRNPFDEDLVYLMGGERRAVEISDFPRLKKRLIRAGDEAHLVDWRDMPVFWKETGDE